MARTPRSHPVTDLLRAYSVEVLVQIARARAGDHKVRGKDALVKLLSKRLTDLDEIRAALTDLHEVERAVLDRLILAGGEAATSVIADELVAEGVIERAPRAGWGSMLGGAVGSSTARGSRKLEDVIARLNMLGLVFVSNAGHTPTLVALGTIGQYLFIPDAIFKHLPPVTIPVQTVDAPAVVMSGGGDDFLRDLYVLLSFADRQPIALTVKGLIMKRILVQIDETLRRPEGAGAVKSEQELVRLPLLRAVAEQLGLITPSAQTLRVGDDAVSFLSLPRGERLRKVFEAYRDTGGWSELSLLRSVLVAPRERMAGAGMTAARKRVLSEIAMLPSGEWIPIQHLLDRMRRTAFEFLLPRGWASTTYSYYGYMQDPYEANPLQVSFTRMPPFEEDPSWDTVEAEVIRTIVTETLRWLGVTELGGDGENPPSLFRITEVGAALLRGQTPPSIVQNPHVVVQPNFQMFAFEPTGEDVLFTLDRIAERVRAEQVVEYHLTRETVYSAQRRGMEMTEILGFLERVSSVPIPQNVRRSLEEWGAQMERVVVRPNVSLLQSIDEETLDGLYDDPDVGQYLGRRLTSTAALVPTQHLKHLHDRLSSWSGNVRGILPAVSEGDDSEGSRVLQVHPDGRITFRQRLPSLYVQAALRRFAEEDGDGALRLTPKSLRLAANSHQRMGETLSADEILKRLTRLSVGAVPGEVVDLVRRWARDWGRGTLAEVTLLRVEREDTLKDLLSDDEVGRFLQPIPGAPTLAAVRRERLERVREILLERGMELGDKITGPWKR